MHIIQINDSFEFFALCNEDTELSMCIYKILTYIERRRERTVTYTDTHILLTNYFSIKFNHLRQSVPW